MLVIRFASDEDVILRVLVGGVDEVDENDMETINRGCDWEWVKKKKEKNSIVVWFGVVIPIFSLAQLKETAISLSAQLGWNELRYKIITNFVNRAGSYEITGHLHQAIKI